MSARRLLQLLLCLAAAIPATARVLSYTPYTNRTSLPATQLRTNRHFVLAEYTGNNYRYLTGYDYGQVVIYDSRGEEEPRAVFPSAFLSGSIGALAAREDANGNVSILVQSNAVLPGTTPDYNWKLYLSNDSGRTWKVVSDFPTDRIEIPEFTLEKENNYKLEVHDLGGPIVRGRFSPIRFGNAEYPFVVAGKKAIYAITPDGRAKAFENLGLAGTDREGNRLLVTSLSTGDISILDLHTGRRELVMPFLKTEIDGWVTPDGNLYFHGRDYDGGVNFVRAVSPRRNDELIGRWPLDVSGGGLAPTIVIVPTADYAGAWIAYRGKGRPSYLLKHTPEKGLVEQWRDPDGPEIEALHTAASGDKLLIQVHRSRPLADQRLFVDPALAIWRVGDPAPAEYDELFMNEKPSKGFVHLDVDEVAQGEPFAFDSGMEFQRFSGGIIISAPPPIYIPPMPAGGGDVIQEWGIARASLRQELVLPGIGRTRGAYDSNWLSDVIIRNPSLERQQVRVRYVANGDRPVIALVPETTISLAPQEIRLIPDVLRTLFGVEDGTGAFILLPEFGVNATSRTYSRGPKGTYGFSMNAIDRFTATGSRFPLSFAAALHGPRFRTNLLLTNSSGAGINAWIRSYDPWGNKNDADASAPAAGQVQKIDIGAGLTSNFSSGAITLVPAAGFALASVVVIDNTTNDPSWFPPDMPAATTRTIPVAGNLHNPPVIYRTDLHLFNSANIASNIAIQIQSWTSSDLRTFNIQLRPYESRVVHDIVRSNGMVGMVRIRVQAPTEAVRVTSRSYTTTADGGTYGTVVPPLNNFQIAGPDDTLEILGAVIDPRFRTALGIVEASAFAGSKRFPATVEIWESGGRLLDLFQVIVPQAGGLQMDDLFRERRLTTFDGEPRPVLIRVTSSGGGLIAAYANMIDLGTNDPSYLAANLGAKRK